MQQQLYFALGDGDVGRVCVLAPCAAAGALAQAAPTRTLHFDLTALPVTRDSFVFKLGGLVRGFAIWQYELRTEGMRQEVIYSAFSEFEPIEDEDLRVVLDRATGVPVSSFHHVELFAVHSDTLMVEHDLRLAGDRVSGRRRVAYKDGKVDTVAVDCAVPPGVVWANYELYAAAVTNVGPGDSLVAPAYAEFGDSVKALAMVGEAPTTIEVPAGKFAVLPLRSGDFRLYVTRVAPRRVIKGETLDGQFSFEFAGATPIVPSGP